MTDSIVQTPSQRLAAAPLGRLIWRELRWLIIIGGLSLGIAFFVRYGLGYPIPLAKLALADRGRKILVYAAVLGPLLLLGALAQAWWELRDPDGRLTRAAWRRAYALRRDELIARAALSTATCLLMVGLFSLFALWKASIPALNPWHWDVTLARIDRLVHGGSVPQDLTRAWIGHLGTIVLDKLYFLYFSVVALFVVWQSFRAPSLGRTRLLLAITMTYSLLGNLGAILLSSGGPVYYERLVGQHSPYGRQAAFLSHFRRLHATRIQENIWQWLQTHTYVPFGSISAMPSMHVALTSLVALGCWQRSRWLGAVAWGYVAMIMLGSVHLNWHYAIDGYVALLGTLLIWWLSGRLVQRLG
jgi:hypothetical protein